MSTILVAIILISFITVVVLVLIRINNRDRKQVALDLLSKFRDKAVENDLSISSQEVVGNMLIGLDGIQRKLLIIKKLAPDKYASQIIHLNAVKSCSKKPIYKNVNVGDHKGTRLEKQVEKIALEFEYIDAATSTEVISFEILSNHMLTMSQLNEKVSKWERMISKLLSNEFKKSIRHAIVGI